ncbi:hypothetical protein MKK55_14410 [Methylobacterium sp. J-059]|uniref:hypothetical protein n=1 Tax=Methylobacterium sp. J-059 TaxID=2836643 RepID=UPI001FBA1A0D|nr:hypothetical protein [Methylobacterium sp. J-059]MCJ2040123.1 hypothetical protein [Methylobacterium sp. J-059]
MPSASTARRPTVAPASAYPEQLGTVIVALLNAIEGLPDGSPTAAAYRSAHRRKGQALAKAGDPAAWAGLQGWRS